MRRDREHPRPPILPSPGCGTLETARSGAALGLSQVSDKLAACGTPATSNFAREDHELAPGGVDEFRVASRLVLLSVSDGDARLRMFTVFSVLKHMSKCVYRVSVRFSVKCVSALVC